MNTMAPSVADRLTMFSASIQRETALPVKANSSTSMVTTSIIVAAGDAYDQGTRGVDVLGGGSTDQGGSGRWGVTDLLEQLIRLGAVSGSVSGRRLWAALVVAVGIPPRFVPPSRISRRRCGDRYHVRQP